MKINLFYESIQDLLKLSSLFVIRVNPIAKNITVLLIVKHIVSFFCDARK